MFKGIIFALAACFIWGMNYVIPQFLNGYSSIEIALWSYLFYGLFSLVIMMRERAKGFCRYPRAIWIKALYFSLVSTLVYYISLVLALRYSNPAITALIMGVSPIMIACYGGWKEKVMNLKAFIVPSILILIGIVIINVPHLHDNESPSDHVLGLFFCCVALVTWSWYVVANSDFLKHNPKVSSSDWSTLIGVSTLFWVAFLTIIMSLFFADKMPLKKYVTFSTELVRFYGATLFLGLVCSWLAAFLWNRATYFLPVSLAGQLTIFETIFGMVFVYTLQFRLPPQTECIGIAFLLGAVAYGIRLTTQPAQAT